MGNKMKLHESSEEISSEEIQIEFKENFVFWAPAESGRPMAKHFSKHFSTLVEKSVFEEMERQGAKLRVF